MKQIRKWLSEPVSQKAEKRADNMMLGIMVFMMFACTFAGLVHTFVRGN